MYLKNDKKNIIQFSYLPVSKWTIFNQIWISSLHHFIRIRNIKKITFKD